MRPASRAAHRSAAPDGDASALALDDEDVNDGELAMGDGDENKASQSTFAWAQFKYNVWLEYVTVYRYTDWHSLFN